MFKLACLVVLVGCSDPKDAERVPDAVEVAADAALDAAVDAPPPAPLRAFVTPLPYPTNFAAGAPSAQAFADGRCKFWGEGIGSTRPWVAWLSTPTSAAIDRFTANGPWQRLDGLPVAMNRADLVDATLANPISINAFGTAVTTSALTGTGIDGRVSQPSASSTCNNWTSLSTSNNYAYGDTDQADAKWTINGFFPACGGPQYPFLCFEQ